MATTNKTEVIDISLPLIADDDERVDQTVPVTINGTTTIIKRGEHVRVKPEVFEVLYNSGKFPSL